MDMILGGESVRRERTLEVRDPFDGSLVDRVPAADADDVAAAVAAAVDGYRDNRDLPSHARMSAMLEVLAPLLYGIHSHHRQVQGVKNFSHLTFRKLFCYLAYLRRRAQQEVGKIARVNGLDQDTRRGGGKGCECIVEIFHVSIPVVVAPPCICTTPEATPGDELYKAGIQRPGIFQRQ